MKDDFYAVDMWMREGKRIKVSPKRIMPGGVWLYFLSPEEYAEYKLERDSGGSDFPYTHLALIPPPKGHYFWTPPVMGEWWVLLRYAEHTGVIIQMVDVMPDPFSAN